MDWLMDRQTDRQTEIDRQIDYFNICDFKSETGRHKILNRMVAGNNRISSNLNCFMNILLIYYCRYEILDLWYVFKLLAAIIPWQYKECLNFTFIWKTTEHMYDLFRFPCDPTTSPVVSHLLYKSSLACNLKKYLYTVHALLKTHLIL
jgi:hypothetical protein